MEINYCFKRTYVILNFIIALVFIIAIVLLISNQLKIGTIIFISTILIIFHPVIYLMIKSFYSMIVKVPGIVLNDLEYKDNISGLCIPWTMVNNVEIKPYQLGYFLAFRVKDKSVIYRQIKNPILKSLIKFESFASGFCFKTNLSYIDVDVCDILIEINKRIKIKSSLQ